MTDITERDFAKNFNLIYEILEMASVKNVTTSLIYAIAARLETEFAQRDAQIAALETEIGAAISEMEYAANDILYAVYNLADIKSALMAERNLRAMAAKLREGK